MSAGSAEPLVWVGFGNGRRSAGRQGRLGVTAAETSHAARMRGNGPRDAVGASNGAARAAANPARPVVIARRFKVTEELPYAAPVRLYAAQDATTGQQVTIAVVGRELAPDAESIRRLAEDARPLAELTSPTVVRMDEFLVDGGTCVIILEPIKGRSLRDLVDSGGVAAGTFPIQRAIDIALGACEGLAALHGVKAHGDLRAEDIWLGDGVKVLDLGVGRRRLPREALVTGQFERAADQRALAGLLFELLTGRGAGSVSTPADAIRREIPVSVAGILERALAGEPSDRFPSIAAFAAALRSADMSVAVPSIEPAPATNVRVSAPWSQRAFAFLLAAAALVWLATMVVWVPAGSTAEILRDGSVARIAKPGLNFKLPWPLEQARVASAAPAAQPPPSEHSEGDRRPNPAADAPLVVPPKDGTPAAPARNIDLENARAAAEQAKDGFEKSEKVPGESFPNADAAAALLSQAAVAAESSPAGAIVLYRQAAGEYADATTKAAASLADRAAAQRRAGLEQVQELRSAINRLAAARESAVGANKEPDVARRTAAVLDAAGISESRVTSLRDAARDAATTIEQGDPSPSTVPENQRLAAELEQAAGSVVAAVQAEATARRGAERWEAVSSDAPQPWKDRFSEPLSKLDEGTRLLNEGRIREARDQLDATAPALEALLKDYLSESLGHARQRVVEAIAGWDAAFVEFASAGVAEPPAVTDARAKALRAAADGLSNEQGLSLLHEATSALSLATATLRDNTAAVRPARDAAERARSAFDSAEKVDGAEFPGTASAVAAIAQAVQSLAADDATTAESLYRRAERDFREATAKAAEGVAERAAAAKQAELERLVPLRSALERLGALKSAAAEQVLVASAKVDKIQRQDTKPDAAALAAATRT